MTEPIARNDLVRQARGCCETTTRSINMFGTVTEVVADTWVCMGCGLTLRTAALARVPEITGPTPGRMFGWIPCEWLRKIPPAEYLEGSDIARRLVLGTEELAG